MIGKKHLGSPASRSKKNRRALEKLLLDIGGERVVGDDADPDIVKVLKRGEKFVTLDGSKVTMKVGQPSRCHQNSSDLWLVNEDNPDVDLRIVTGYALNDDDGIWYCHTWLKDLASDTIIETTILRDIYFGVALDEDESQRFAVQNSSI